eukprot:scaffold283959_cov28-Tisochrysis_lutea.AAC.1
MGDRLEALLGFHDAARSRRPRPTGGGGRGWLVVGLARRAPRGSIFLDPLNRTSTSTSASCVLCYLTSRIESGAAARRTCTMGSSSVCKTASTYSMERYEVCDDRLVSANECGLFAASEFSSE